MKNRLNYARSRSRTRSRSCVIVKLLITQNTTVETFNLPNELRPIERSAGYLKAVIESYAWRSFLKRELERNNLNYAFIFESGVDVPHLAEYTCLEMLTTMAAIFDSFIEYLNYICSDEEQSLFKQLKRLFPDKRLVNTEFIIMRSFLVGMTISRLETLLNYWKDQEEIISFCKGCINLCTEYNIDIRGKLIVFQDVLKMNDQTSSKTCLTTYENYCAHFGHKYSTTVIKVVSHWNLSYDLLKYLRTFPEADMEDFLELLNNWDEASLNTKPVLDFVTLKRYFLIIDAEIELIRAKTILTFDDIITCLEKVMKNYEPGNILSSFESCSKTLMTIERLHTESKNKEQSKKTRILDITHDSQFCFSLRKSDNTIFMSKYQFDVYVMMNIREESLSFIDLNDLRDRARLIDYAQAGGNNVQNYSETDIRQLQSFISLVDTIEEVLHTFNSLYAAGYPVNQEYPMTKTNFTCHEGKYDELKKLKETLVTDLADWEKELLRQYKKCVNLTYLSYEQISMIEEAVLKQTLTKPDDLTYHLLKFMGVDPTSIETSSFSIKSENPSNLLNNVTTILENRRDIQSLTVREDETINEKIFLVETTESGILRAILSLFHLDDGASPVANQLFYCTQYTSWVEIRAFVYRCFYSQTLHQLIRPELLSIMIQDQFAQLVNKLIAQSPNHFFRLGAIATVSSAQLYVMNSLNSQRNIKIIREQELLTENDLKDTIRKLIADHCTLVTSRIAGLGKSTFIKNQIRGLKRTLINFPISGDINIDTLAERLRDEKIQSAPSTIALHINIGPVENVQQLNEFLYCLVLFRCFRLVQTPINVPHDVSIYIELDSSPYLRHLLDEIIIFKYAPRKHIDGIDWDELETASPIIQFVVNYLEAIDNKTISAREINAQTIAFVDKSICISLLKKYFLSNKNAEFITWTQLFIFISVYYTLFSGFSRCGYLTIADSENLSSLRQDILDSLLNSSTQFTSLSVETVFRNQQAIHDNEIVRLGDAIIRWDRCQPFTVIFSAFDDPLFVYKRREDIPTSLLNLFRSYYQAINTQHNDKNVKKRKFPTLYRRTNSVKSVEQVTMPTVEQQLDAFLADPNQLTHEQFFLRLTSLTTRYFAQKSICVTCFKQYDYNDQICTNCPEGSFLLRPDAAGKPEDMEDFHRLIAVKLQSEYVLTADNYLKMLLIYLRVKSNLPVLIMGETGRID